ncbi:MAG: DUF4281 domain-containing protein [Flavobacteriales bacterium]|nr:DUF4281 domain-containing protein [Flavobacteriales bacterium]
MNIYEIIFILSTFWVGPFWFAMLLQPKSDKTKKLLAKPLFFFGPIVLWFIVIIISPDGLSKFGESFSHDQGFLIGLIDSLSSEAGITATWAHMVAGDIFATRWIWKKSLEHNIHPILRSIAIFFGVMLMPIGILILILSTLKKEKYL